MAKRERIKGHGIPEHPQPFPAAVKIGNMVFSAGISGEDPETEEVPDGIDAQCKNAFGNMRRMIEQAGGTTANIAKVVVYLKDRGNRDVVNQHWTAMFPDEDDRPVRHTLANPLGGNREIQMEFIGVL
jgi:2-iminobutanoate/2-iminopropanoate deaminase